MRPIKTKFTTIQLHKPKDWSEKENGKCSELWAGRVGDIWFSTWKPTFWEMIKMLFGAHIRLCLISKGHPPVMLDMEP